MVALIRVITSPPNGCCRLSIDATATGVPVVTSSRVATTVVVPRSKAMAYWVPVVSPGSTSISASSTTTAVTLKSAARSTPGSLRSTCRSGCGSRSSIAASSRSRSVCWSSSVGSTSSTYRFWMAGRRITWRPTPTVAALGRGGGGGGEGGYVDDQGAGRVDQAGEPPAVVELLRAEGADVVPGDRRRTLDPDPALVAGAVASAR